jgi:magnesium transporter
MKHDLNQLVKTTGLPPGMVTNAGHADDGSVSLMHIHYHRNGMAVDLPSEVSDIQLKPNRQHWVDIIGLNDPSVIVDMGERFNLHPLVMEDITNTAQLPKMDEHDDAFFILAKAITFDGNDIVFEHIAIYMRDNLLLSFQEYSSDTFHIVKQRMQDKVGKITKKNVDYLMYALLDYVIDTYFVVLRKIDGRVSMLNQEVDDAPNASTLKNIQHLKKQVLMLKRYFWVVRDIVLALKKSESPLMSTKTKKYLVDCYDHISHIIDISESFQTAPLKWEKNSAMLGKKQSDL